MREMVSKLRFLYPVSLAEPVQVRSSSAKSVLIIMFLDEDMVTCCSISCSGCLLVGECGERYDFVGPISFCSTRVRRVARRGDNCPTGRLPEVTDAAIHTSLGRLGEHLPHAHSRENIDSNGAGLQSCRGCHATGNGGRKRCIGMENSGCEWCPRGSDGLEPSVVHVKR